MEKPAGTTTKSSKDKYKKERGKQVPETISLKGEKKKLEDAEI